MNAVHPVAPHFAALSSLLSHDTAASTLHPRQLQLLALICAASPVSVHEAAAALAVSQSVASRDASRLVDGGLVSRSDKPNDRRIVQLVPTPSGKALDARVRTYVAACNP
jgi:DNA-binding MarR family transcriptional regulator